MKDFLTKIWNHNVDISKAFIFLFSIIIIVLILPGEAKFQYDFQKGKLWRYNDLIASFDFSIIKSDNDINAEKISIIYNLKPYFIYHDSIKPQKKLQLIDDFNKLWNNKYKTIIKTKEHNLNVCLKIFDTIYNIGILEPNQIIDKKPPDFNIIVLNKNIGNEIEIKDKFNLKTAMNWANKEIASMKNIDKDIISTAIQNSLTYNIIYDPITTEKEKEQLINNVTSNYNLIQSGDRIISKGELITTDKYNKILSYKNEFLSQTGSFSNNYIILIGRLILVTISLFVLFMYIAIFRRQVFNDNKKILLILLLVFLIIFSTSIIGKYKIDLLYVVPFCIIPIVIRAFFDSRLSLFVFVIVIIINSFIVPNSFDFAFLQLIAGIITIFSIVNLQNRSQFFLTSLFIFIAYSVTYTGIIMMQDGSFNSINTFNYILFACSSVLSLFSYPLIFLFEKIFGFITDVSLLELSSTNKKALRELSSKAPGTFQHSLQVANLAEEAAFKIKANAMLVRTGALYHDLGKIDIPLYFTENQISETTPHDDLSFEESANIIISHVLNGVKKAKKYNIPEQVIDFIRTHHGTSKTRYFYSMQLKNVPQDEKIDDESFTYQGPVPFSKETALIMMADAVEAASHSIKKPDENSINNLVETIINKQIEDNQLINSDITLKDINIVKKIFKRKLMNIYHLRIEYPE